MKWLKIENHYKHLNFGEIVAEIFMFSCYRLLFNLMAFVTGLILRKRKLENELMMNHFFDSWKWVAIVISKISIPIFPGKFKRKTRQLTVNLRMRVEIELENSSRWNCKRNKNQFPDRFDNLDGLKENCFAESIALQSVVLLSFLKPDVFGCQQMFYFSTVSEGIAWDFTFSFNSFYYRLCKIFELHWLERGRFHWQNSFTDSEISNNEIIVLCNNFWC